VRDEGMGMSVRLVKKMDVEVILRNCGDKFTDVSKRIAVEVVTVISLAFRHLASANSEDSIKTIYYPTAAQICNS